MAIPKKTAGVCSLEVYHGSAPEQKAAGVWCCHGKPVLLCLAVVLLTRCESHNGEIIWSWIWELGRTSMKS